MTKKLSIVLQSVLAILLIGSISQVAVASAGCVFTGKISRTYTNTLGNYTFFYVVPETSAPYNPEFAYYTRVSGSSVGTLVSMNAAYAAGLTVRCEGDSTSCPTSHYYRWAGNTRYCYVYRNQ